MTADTRSSSAACDQILARLLALHPKVIDLSLDRVHRLLDRLGNPQDRLPPVVHVAGTNGKGSVIALLRALLEAQGLRVHVHISPHLVRFNERIQLAGREITDTDLEDLLAECEAVNGGQPITFFEITTAAALLAFSRTPADIVILETGLGGRLDATNVVRRPLLNAITPVSLDHQQFLGETVAAIAGEKAGIMRPGVPCVIGAQVAQAQAVLDDKARALGAPTLSRGRDWEMTETAAGGLHLDIGGRLSDHPAPALAGRHQLANAAQALVCLDVLTAPHGLPGLQWNEALIAQGLAAARWPARLQRLTQGPLVDALPQGWELWLDGGHNVSAGGTIAGHAEDAWSDRPLHLICGMLNSKDPAAFLTPLAAVAASLVGVAIPGEVNSLSADEMAEAGKARGLPAEPAVDVASALSKLKAGQASPARILICGSLYLAGVVLSDNG